MDDIVELIIYIAIGIAGLLVSAYRNKQKRQSQQNRMPRDIMAKPMPEVLPDLGPLAEIFGLPEIATPKPVYVPEREEQDVAEFGSQVEKEGILVENLNVEAEPKESMLENAGLETESINYEGMPVFKSTEAAIISDSISDTAIEDSEGIYDMISASEIKSIDESEKITDNESIDWRKAIIYSEILKRRGN